MPNMTLLESAQHSTDDRQKGVMKLITERTPILQYLSWETIQGNAYTYDVEQSLPGIAFRAVGETYPRSTHVINSLVERLHIMGGEVYIDRFQWKTQGNKVDIKARAWESKSRALALAFSEQFFEGDSTANFRVFDGIRNRLTGNQVVTAGANGATLTLDMADMLIDKVVGNGEGDVHMFLNKTLRRKFTTLARNIPGGYSMIDTGNDKLGRQVKKYNDVPMHIIERDDNEATFLDFDETVGSSNVTASIYVVRFGDDYVHGIAGAGGSMDVYDLGESQTEVGIIGRLEWYPGLVVPHPRAAARLAGVTNT